MWSMDPSYTSRREYFVRVNSSAASSFAAVMGSAVRSTRWMRMSSAVCSEKPMAFFSSSPSSRSILPSCCTSSTNSSSSSWDILLSPFSRNTRLSSFFHRANIAFSGVSTQMSTCRMGADSVAHFSAQSLAMLLGEISPKISTTTVTTTVEMVAPASP